ncbi:MAG: hypothetical protein M3383_02925 [Actinomycetota bacterium]|nr:hypothetical protein [Actinomycetota bacterium]
MGDARHALAGTLALLALTTAGLFLLALVGDRSGQPVVGPVSGVDPPTNLDPDRLLRIAADRLPKVAARVERIRGLEFDRIPKPRISDAADRRRLAERELERPRVKRRLREEEVQLRILALLDDGESVEQVAKDSTALAAAYYDTRRRGTLFLVGDAVPAGPEVTEFILAHELTHALEDQRFGLRDSAKVTGDSGLARSAFHEGTASAVMQVYAAEHLDRLNLIAEAGAVDTGDVELPAFVEAQVEFTYGAGARFVEVLREYAKGWGLVDYAFAKRKLSTTEQILHPEKYIAGEEALDVPVPRSPGREWSRSDTGTIGEWATRQLLTEGNPGIGASIAAAGWGGDRYALFEREGARASCVADCLRHHGMALHWRYDSAAEAKELERELRVYVEQALEGEPSGNRWKLEAGWASLQRSGDRLGLGLGPDPRVTDRLGRPPR